MESLCVSQLSGGAEVDAKNAKNTKHARNAKHVKTAKNPEHREQSAQQYEK